MDGKGTQVAGTGGEEVVLRQSPTLLVLAWILACGSEPGDPLQTVDELCDRDFVCMGFVEASQCVDFLLQERDADAELGCESRHDRALECLLDNPQPCEEWGQPSSCDRQGEALDRCRE